MPRVAILLVLLLVGCGGAERAAAPKPTAPAGTLVILSGQNRLTTIDVASGRRETRRIRSLPPCSGDLFVTGGHIVFSAVVDGDTTVYSIPLALDRRPTRLGTAHAFVPSATEGRVWLAGTDCDRREMVGAREVSVDGEVTFESTRRVPGSWVSAAMADGLVVLRRRGLVAWDPGTGRTTPLGLAIGFGAHGSLLAGCTNGSACDDLAVFDAATGRTVTSESRRLQPAAAFSPDGSWLAAPVMAGRRMSVALVDPSTGRHVPVRGSGTGTGHWYPELAWSSSGWLFIRAGFGVKAYRPGAARAVRLPIRLPETTIAFAAG